MQSGSTLPDTEQILEICGCHRYDRIGNPASARYGVVATGDVNGDPPLEADAVTVAHDQDADHKLWIDRRPANVAIKGRRLSFVKSALKVGSSNGVQSLELVFRNSRIGRWR